MSNMIEQSCLTAFTIEAISKLTVPSDTHPTLQAIVKLTAQLPFGHAAAYFYDNWNVLDFCIVVAGWLTVAMNTGSATILRTFRIVKPLRTMSHIKELSVLLDALIESGKPLIPVFGLFFIATFLFSIIGLQAVCAHVCACVRVLHAAVCSCVSQ